MESAQFQWIRTGDEALAQMLAAIQQARHSVRLEMYIFNPGPPADLYRDALIAACQRGLKVRVLCDALGSISLPNDYWNELRAKGGEFRWFNPFALHRFGFRDHRKLLVCDDQCAFIGGFNVGTEYTGDGITRGWRDLGIVIKSNLARELAGAFDEMFACADFRHPPFARLFRSRRQKTVPWPGGKLLLSAPGRNCPFRTALRDDLRQATQVQILCAYFLPTWRIRRELTQVVKRGGRVQLILPGKTDVPLAYLAGQNFYSRLLKAGVEIYEYQPQVLHAKVIIIDNVVYAGSANLDSRSFNINYELLLRLPNADLAAQGRDIFCHDLQHSRQINLESWSRSKGLWDRLKSRCACYFLSRIDPLIARYQWRKIVARGRRLRKNLRR